MIQQSNEINELGVMLKNGDTEAFEKIYKKSIQWVRSDVYKHIKDDDVEDCVQDIYIKLYNNIGQYNPEKGKFTTWFNTLVSNEIINFARRYHTKMVENMEYIDDDENFNELVDLVGVTPEQYVENEEVKHIIAKLLGEINESQKSCISMIFIDDMSYKDTAKALGISEGTVKSRVFNGLKKIRLSIEGMKKKGVAIFGVAPVPTFLYMLKNCNFTSDAKTIEAGWAAISAHNRNGELRPSVEVKASSAVKASSLNTANEAAKHGLKHKLLVGLTGTIVAGGIAAGTFSYLSNDKNEKNIEGNYNNQKETVSYSTDNLKSAYEILVEKGELSEPIDGYESGNIYIPEYVYEGNVLATENCLIYGFDNIDKADEGNTSIKPHQISRVNNVAKYNNYGEKVNLSYNYENRKWNYIDNEKRLFKEKLYDDNGKSLIVNGEYAFEDTKFTFDEHGNITGYLERGVEDGNKDKYFYLYYSEYYYDDLGRIKSQLYYAKYYNDSSNHDCCLTIDDIKSEESVGGEAVIYYYDEENNLISKAYYSLYEFNVVYDSNGEVVSIIQKDENSKSHYEYYEYYYDGILKAKYCLPDNTIVTCNINGSVMAEKNIDDEVLKNDLNNYLYSVESFYTSEHASDEFVDEYKGCDDFFKNINEHETIDNYYEEADGKEMHIRKKIYKDGYIDYDISLIDEQGQIMMKTDYTSDRDPFEKYVVADNK